MTAPLPNTLIVGAQKAGTTTLHRLLESHPRIFTPRKPQEIHFFDLDENFRRGLSWYRAKFAAWSGEPIVFQTSPLYLYEPAAPERIARFCPEVRIIVLLREPVARAYSHFRHEVRFGWESLPFAEALRRERYRILRGPVARRHYSYADRGRYRRQIGRYLEHFSHDRLLFLRWEDLVRSPPALAVDIVAWLGLPANEDWEKSVRATSWRFNSSLTPRWPHLQRMTRRLRLRLPALVRLLDALNLREGYPAPMPPGPRLALASQFSTEIGKLEKLTGLDLATWHHDVADTNL